jgi:hypothetical protein
MDKVSLADAITNLRTDLTKARDAGEDKELRFNVESIEIELQAVAETDVKTGVGVNWWILSGNVDAGHTNTITQTLKLTLSVAPGEDGKPRPISDRKDERKHPKEAGG